MYKTMKYIIVFVLILFFSGCEKVELQISELTRMIDTSLVKEETGPKEAIKKIKPVKPKTIKKRTKIKKTITIQNPYDKIKSFTTQEKIAILTQYYFEQNYKISKPIMPNKPTKPAIPTADELTKGEFESTYDFNLRIQAANKKRENQINKIRDRYENRVNTYNQKVQRLINEHNSKIKQLKTNESKLLSNAASKALSIIYGKPYLQNLKYDADNERFFALMLASKGDFREKVTIKVPRVHAKSFKQNVHNLKPKIVFELHNDKFFLKRLDVPHKDKTYVAILTDINYKPESIKVTLNKGSLNLEEAQFLEDDFKIAKGSYQLSSLDYSIDPEIAKMQKRKFELEEIARKKRLQESKAKEFARIKAQYEESIKKLEKKAGGYDDIPDLLQNIKPAIVDNKKWLVIIAIEDYEVTTSVNFAKNSAIRFQQVAQKTLGIANSNVRTLINATSGTIKSQLKAMLRRVEKGDTLYFYYSGHGIPVASQNNEPYILPKDMSPDYIQDEDFFRLQNIYKRLTDSYASKVIAFADSCFSGVTDNKSVLREGLGATRLKPRNVNFDSKKMVIITAGTGKQYSNMYEQKSHRLFSYFVMKSLLKGNKTIKSLHQDIYKNVKKASYKLGSLYEQHPTIEGNKGLKL